jgi:hypothetical protein
MNIQEVKEILKEEYPRINFKENKEDDIVFIFHNLEDEYLHDEKFNQYCYALEHLCDVSVSIEFNKQAL